MSATSPDAILIAASDVDDRLLECLADCHATLVRTFDEAQRALQQHLFKMVVIDLNFDNVRMFDLLQYVRSLADFSGVPVLCIQGTDAGAGISAALDRLVRMLGGKAFIDLRGSVEVRASTFQRLCQILGAEFDIDRTLPRSRQSPASEVRRPTTKDQSRATNDATASDRLARLCVLIIDHAVDTAHRLGEIVEQLGHDADFAYNGVAGLDAARRLRPDVVFVDLALPPPLDGCDVVQQLRRDPDLRGGLVIALTATADAEDRQRMREAGFDHHIIKPADRQSIQGLLDTLLAPRAS